MTRRSDYFGRYDKIQRLNVRGPVPGCEPDPEEQRRAVNRAYALEIAGYSFLILIGFVMVAGVLQYDRECDQVAANEFIDYLVNPCLRCHALELQDPPTLNTRERYARYYNHNPPLSDLVRR